MKLEKSDGNFFDPVSEGELSGALGKIGRGLDFCILSDGDDFIQSADSDGGLIVQYRDSSGQYESDDSSISLEKANEIFLSYLKGDGTWKTAASYSKQEDYDSSDNSNQSSRSGQDSFGGNISGDSIKDTLLHAVKSEASRGVSSMVRRFIRNIFR